MRPPRTARRVRPGRRVRDRRERTPVRGGQPRMVEPPGRRPVRCRRRLAGRRGPRGLRAALGHEADPARPGPERRLARDHRRRRARRHERIQRQAGVGRLARPARDDHALRVPGRAPGRPRLRHPCGARGLARRTARSLAAGHDYFGDITSGSSWGGLGAPFLFSAALALFFSWRIDVNVFAFHMFYRNRLVRCYLGASNPRRANHPFTGFDGDDSVPMKDLRQRPYHLVNAALNITRGTRLAWQERKAASFVASPMFCGYELKDDDRAGARELPAHGAVPRRGERGAGWRRRTSGRTRRRGARGATIRIRGRSSWGSGPRSPSPARRRAPTRAPIPLPRSRS